MSLATAQYSGWMQGELWSARALDWANYQEVQFHDVYGAVLVAVPTIAGKRMLDVGSGSGAFLRRACKHGAIVSGLDAATGLATIAKYRVPDADVRVGEMEALPYANASFDIVTGINSFPEASDPVAALAEARRVLRPRGHLVAVTWGSPEQVDVAAHMTAVRPLLPGNGRGMADPFAYSAPGALSELVRQAGFVGAREHEVLSTWEYDDESSLLGGLLSAAPLVRAAAHSGAYAVASAVMQAVSPYRLPGGGYRFHNRFRYVVATVGPTAL